MACRLGRSFYRRPTLEVARDVIGMILVDNRDPRTVKQARIVEVEAYIGEDDPACHAACGPTERNRPMYGVAGHTYIYLIYGMYHCLNFVTERKGYPAAVLIRAAERKGDWPDEPENHIDSRALSGPGKLCRGYELDKRQSGLDLTEGPLYLRDGGSAPAVVETAPRIGVRLGAELPWRFFDPQSTAVSFKARRVR